MPTLADQADQAVHADPYVTVTLLEGRSQPSARTKALSSTQKMMGFPTSWGDELELLLAAGSVRPPLLRVSVWDSTGGDGGEAADAGAEGVLLGSKDVRLADVERGKVLDLELEHAGEGGSFSLSFAFALRPARPRQLTLRRVMGFSVPASRVRGHASEPYVRFSVLGAGSEPRQTEPCVEKLSGNPVWPDELSLELPAELEGPLRLEVEVVGHDKMRGDAPLCGGGARLPEGTELGTVRNLRLRGVGGLTDCLLGFEFEVTPVTPATELRLSRVQAHGVPRGDDEASESDAFATFYTFQDGERREASTSAAPNASDLARRPRTRPLPRPASAFARPAAHAPRCRARGRAGATCW